MVLIACGREASELKIVAGHAPQTLVAQSTLSLVQGNTELPFCSGTLIAKHLVLTAAHCVTDKAADSIQVRLSSGQLFPVVATQAFKPEQKYGVNFDVAWVKFEGDVPDAFIPMELWRDPSLLSGSTVTLAGYGQTKSSCSPADPKCSTGRLLEVEAKVSEFIDRGRWHHLLLTQSATGQGPCLGDSGGPLFVERHGQLYLGGNFVGWDKRLVPEQATRICDNGQAIYNAAGAYFDWIEASSGVKLPHHAEQNPLPPPGTEDVASGTPKTFREWCAYRNDEDPAWYTTQRLVSLAGDYALDHGGDIRLNFEDCAVAEANLLSKIEEDKGLDLDAFAPNSFGPQAQITDLRPLLALDAVLERLTLSGHALTDFSPLASLRKLRKLEIIDNQGPVATALDPSALNVLETLTMRNSSGSVQLQALSQLKSLRNLEITREAIPEDMHWEGLLIRNLRLEGVTSAAPLDLELPKLNILTVHAKVSVQLPAAMNNLQTLDLKGLDAFVLPRALPKLRSLIVKNSQQLLRLNGALRFENLSALETLEFSGNRGLEDFSLPPKLAKLRSVVLSDNELRSIGGFTGMIKLTKLDISGNRIETMPYLEDLPLLQTFDASQNLLRDSSGLETMSSIVDLDLSDNPLDALDGLGQLLRLKKLGLERIREGTLDSLDGLGALPQLEELRVGGNSFRSVTDFLRFPKLQVLILSDNQIQDLAKLEALTALSYLEVVNNPLLQDLCPLSNPKYCRFEWANADR